MRLASVPRAIAAAALAGALAGCASTVTPVADTGSGGGAPIDARAGTLAFSLSKDAQTMERDNPVFSVPTLRQTLERTLRDRGVLVDGVAQTLSVEVTRLRARSTGAALWAGALAGNDEVGGTVTLSDASGKVLRRFNVDATYGWGGLAGSSTDMRMKWLYDTFANDTAAALGRGAK